MKRYCKNIDITDVNVIRQCIWDCLDGKFRRDEVVTYLSDVGLLTKGEIMKALNTGNKGILAESINIRANMIKECLLSESVELTPIRWDDRIDGNSGKVRRIGTESIEHQIYDYIAVYAIKDLCYAKIGKWQCACLPNRGQLYGKNKIEKWLHHDKEGTKYCVKMDIRQCYPSIDHKILKGLLRRDIKNDKVLWLIELLIDQFESGLSIGSYLSQYLCNYYLSYAYHYASEQLAINRTRRGVTKRVRLFSHILFYMDDIIMLGGNKRYLKQAFLRFREYLLNTLSLHIKDTWRLFRVQYMDKSGKLRGQIIDMMGYKIGRLYTTVRRKIFYRARRKLLKIEKLRRYKLTVSRHLAASAVSLYGWFMHCNCYKIQKRFKKTVEFAKKIISYNAKKKIRRQQTCYSLQLAMSN